MEPTATSVLLSEALANHPVNGDSGKSQLAALWHADFDVKEDPAGRKVLVSKDGRPTDQVIRERLESPDYAHFKAPPRQVPRASDPSPGDKPCVDLGMNRGRYR